MRLPMHEKLFQYLGWDDLVERDMENISSILTSKIPWSEGPGGLQSAGLPKNQTRLND